MPEHFFKDGDDREIPISLEACSRTLPHFYHALRKKDGQLITFHRNQLVTKYSPEELAAIEKRKLQEALQSLDK